MSYDLPEHRHRFAVWAAARASQHGFTTVEPLRDALQATDIRKVLSAPQTLQLSALQFDALHRRWCSSICSSLGQRRIAKVTYGRAAKLVAVYLKAIVHKAAWRSINWTQLNESAYGELIGQLRNAIPCGAPFWTIEEYWEPSDTGERRRALTTRSSRPLARVRYRGRWTAGITRAV